MEQEIGRHHQDIIIIHTQIRYTPTTILVILLIHGKTLQIKKDDLNLIMIVELFLDLVMTVMIYLFGEITVIKM